MEDALTALKIKFNEKMKLGELINTLERYGRTSLPALGGSEMELRREVLELVDALKAESDEKELSDKLDQLKDKIYATLFD